MILQRNKMLKILCGASEKNKFISMQKKTREDKTQKCNSAVLWSKKQKNNISKILRRAKKKKNLCKKHQRRYKIREDKKQKCNFAK